MPTLTDYLVLSDVPFTLENPFEFKTLEFNLPDDYVKGTNFAKPIIMLQAKPLTDNVKLHVMFNSDIHVQIDAVFKLEFINVPRIDHGQWECVSGDLLFAGKNTCRFRNFGDSSSQIRIRDVVLWFQRKVSW
jgi:hypothetical protein